jgi:hypothetical protein
MPPKPKPDLFDVIRLFKRAKDSVYPTQAEEAGDELSELLPEELKTLLSDLNPESEEFERVFDDSFAMSKAAAKAKGNGGQIRTEKQAKHKPHRASKKRVQWRMLRNFPSYEVAFRANPMLYEVIREWMAMRLQTNPKNLTIIGSGRIGYSVSPLPKFGQEFSSESDLDFSLIDHRVFSELVGTYFQWESDVDLGRSSPRDSKERRFWNDHLKRLPENIARGFIDPYKIPSWKTYVIIPTIQNTLYLIGERLKVTPGAPRIKEVSIRVYKDWDAFFRQMCLNFSLTVASHLGTNARR